jgi:GAF domain-containing protein/CheY-like chemotaxis protein
MRTNAKSRTLHARIMRRVVIIVMSASIVLAVILFAGALVNGQEQLVRGQQATLDRFAEDITLRLGVYAAEVSRLAGSRAARDFARDTLVNVRSSGLGESQTRLLSDFSSLLESRINEYLAARYVTATGSIWTAVTNYSGTSPTPNTQVVLNYFRDDPTLLSSLSLVPGQVAALPLSFYSTPETRAREQIVPFIRFASPIVVDNDTLGLIQLDVSASDLLNDLLLDYSAVSAANPARQMYLIDTVGRIILDSTDTQDQYLRALADRSGIPVGVQVSSMGNVVMTGSELAVDVGDVIYSSRVVGLGSPVDLGWRLLLVEDEAFARQAFVTSGVSIAALVIGGAALICLFLNSLIGRLLRPIETMNAIAQPWLTPPPPAAIDSTPVRSDDMFAALQTGTYRRSAAALTPPPAPIRLQPEEIARAPQDIQDVLSAFRAVDERIQTMKTESQYQVERYARNLDIAARISRQTATLHDIDSLLNRAINLICAEYGFYHAQVFLIDDAGVNAVLRYSAGERGAKLIQGNHRLPVGSASVIGRVTATGKPVIVHDTAAVEPGTHRANPLLPDTRTEMALPLTLGDQIIGALDIQHSTPNTFREDELSTFQLLADQIALAVANARLIRQVDEQQRALTASSGTVSPVSWAEANRVAPRAYRYDLLDVRDMRPADGAPPPPPTYPEDTTQGGQADNGHGSATPAAANTPDERIVSLPIAIRGEVVGSLDASAPENGFSEGDWSILRAVADRVSLVIENARLFEETQNALEESYTLYNLSRALNDSESQEDVLRAILTSLMIGANSGQIALFDEYPAGGRPAWLTFTADINIDGTDRGTLVLTGGRLELAAHPLLEAMVENQVVLINDVERDNRLDATLRAILHSLGAQSLAIIPFVVRGVWRGLVMAQYPGARTFNEREGRVFAALIDQAGVTIDNRMLLRDNELALSQIERLYTASRITNMAETPVDLVLAAIATTTDPSFSFELGVLEGALDEGGWGSRVRIRAQSEEDRAVAVDRAYEKLIPLDSPLREREPHIVIDQAPDSPNPSPLYAFLRERGRQFLAIFPLFSANQPIALLIITAPDPRDLTTEDYEVYRALTGQMSTVLQNRRLLDSTAEALDETRRLYAASRALAAAFDAETIYATAAQYLALALPELNRVSVLAATPLPVFDTATVEVTYQWQRHVDLPSDLRMGDTIPSILISFAGIAAMQEGRIAVFNRAAEQLPVVDGALNLLMQNNEARAVAIVEIRARQNWYGVLLIESAREDTLSESFTRYLTAIADQVAIAVDSLALFREAQAQAQRALALAEAGQLASQIGEEFERSIAEVFRRVADPAGYDRWALMLADDSGRRLKSSLLNFAGTGGSYYLGDEDYFDVQNRGLSFVDAFVNNETLTINYPSDYGIYATVMPEFVEAIGKHIVTPVVLNETPIGVVMVGRALIARDLDSADLQLVRTLAAQIAVAVENRRLFQSAENERGTLRSILATLPAGVLVIDPDSFRPLQTNQQVEQLLGRPVALDAPFSAATYRLSRTGTSGLYEDAALPIYRTRQSGQATASDDLTTVHEDGTLVNLLINAAPILDANGSMTAIVAAFQDITTLRQLESTLQINLQDTTILYDTTRALAEAAEIDDVLDEAINRLILQQPDDAFVLLLDDELQGMRAARTMNAQNVFPFSPDILDGARSLFIENTAAPLDELRRDRFAIDRDAADRLLLAGVRALCSVPMRSRSRADTPLGWLVMTYNRPTTFGIEREQFLTTLSDSVAVALDNRYLFRSTQVALRETASLYGATTAISRAADQMEIALALQNALNALKPDFQAGYLVEGSDLETLFNIDLDGAPTDFKPLIARHDLLHGQPTLIYDDVSVNDIPTPLEDDLISVGSIRGFALVLLRGKDGTAGCFIVGYHQPHRFTDGESKYLSAIADSTSLVVNNIALFAQIESTLLETRILYESSRALADAVTPEDVLRTVVEHLTNRAIDQVFVIRLTTDDWYDSGTIAHIAAFWQSDPEMGVQLGGVSLTAEQFPGWRLLASSSVLMIDDIALEESADVLERVGIESLDMRAISVLPLRAGGRDLGAIVIGTRKPYKHSYQDARIYQSLSEQASLRMEATRLLEQTERRARQLVTSAQVSQIASSILELTELFPRIVDLVRESFNYDHVQIFMMDAEGEFAELRASTGEAGRQLLAIRHKLGKGSYSVIGQVTERAEPFIAADTADARVVHKPNPYLPNTRSEMAIPLMLKGNVVGALDVQSNTPNAFGEDDIAVLTTLANQIAVAIDNARLYEGSQRRAAEMSFLFSTTTAAAAANSLSEALRNIADELRAALTALSVTIYLPENYVEPKTGATFVLLRAAALSGVDQPMSEVTEILLDSDNLIAEVAKERQPLVIADLRAKPDYLPVIEEARAAAIVPLSVVGQLVGVITMESAQPNAYSDDTLQLLLTLAGSLSAVIQNQALLETVQKTNAQLLELDQLKSQFLANMSHELRTPLNSIIGFSRVILKGIDGPLTEMQEQDLTTIYNSGQHLLNLINDILDQAKIQAGKMDLQSDYFDMKSVVDAVRSIGIGLVKDKPIDIFVEVQPGMPKAFGDEFRTRQVLLNLVSNAAKFTREGTITITSYTERDEDSGRTIIRVDVTDTGIGIAESDMGLLFEAFRQVDSSLTRTQGGTGLGLPIAKSLIEMQGGRMVVASRINVGSTFSILLPIEPVMTDERKPPTGSLANGKNETDEIPAAAPLINARETLETGPLRFVRPLKRQMLLIEDDPEMVDQVRRVLQREGFEIYTASIPLEAKPMASGLRPTLIVMDVNFAAGAGWEILEWLKSRDDTRDIPVVVVSLTDEVERVVAGGAFQFVARPFMPEQLIDAVRAAEQESRISRILIIDDQTESVRMLEKTLHEGGSYRVYSAANGADGIAQVARRRPDLVILDLRMPEMDGFQVIRELRNNPETATIPILVVTADTLDSAERDQLSHLEVIAKEEINAQSRRFIEGVRTRLTKD